MDVRLASKQFEGMKAAKGWRERLRLMRASLVFLALIGVPALLTANAVLIGVACFYTGIVALVFTVAFFERPFTIAFGALVLVLSVGGLCLFSLALAAGFRDPARSTSAAGMVVGMFLCVAGVVYGVRQIRGKPTPEGES